MTELTQRLNQNQSDDRHLELRKTHIKTWRYRVYIFFLLIILVLIEPFFNKAVENVRGEASSKINIASLSTRFDQRGAGGKITELEEVQKKIDEVNAQIQRTEIEIAIVNSLQSPEKQNTILNCINFEVCENLPIGLLERIDLLRSYLIVNQLSADKLDFDQKFILRNINEFLSQKVGRGQLIELTSITFGEPAEIKPEFRLFAVPISMHVKYDTNEDFMAFLHNIETKMSATLPVMRRIEAVNYDIVNYQDAQEVEMRMSIYYFKFNENDERLT